MIETLKEYSTYLQVTMKHSTHRNGIEEDTKERDALQGPRYNEINFCESERISSV
jgi:hypothetical protein